MTNGGYVSFLNRQKTDMKFCMFWILFTFLGAVKGMSCQEATTQYSLSGASLCYNTSGTGHRVVLDAFDVQSSSVTNCRCTVTTTHSTKISFAALNSLQPNNFCYSSIVISKSTEGISLNCFVYGSLNINDISETMSISFEKPPNNNYDANYCIILTPDNAAATLSLKCEGDFPGLPSSTPTTQSTTTTTLPRTTTTTQSTTSTSTTRPTTTTLAPTTTTTTTSLTSTTKSTSTSTETSTASSTSTSPQVSTQSTTTQKHSTTGRTAQSTTNRTCISGLTTTKEANTGKSAASTSEWSYIIPVIGAGLIVVVAIILAICYSQRKKRRNTYTHGNDSYAFKNKANSPYSPDFYAGPGMTSKISTSTKSTEINTIVIDDVRDDVSVSTNLSEGTYIRHNVRQPINNHDTPMYAVVHKSAKENKPVTGDKATNQPLSTDVVYSQVDKLDNQNYQPTEADVVY